MSARFDSSEKSIAELLSSPDAPHSTSKPQRSYFKPFSRKRTREEDRCRDTLMEVAVAIAMPIAPSGKRRTKDLLGGDDLAKTDEAPTLCLGLVEVPWRDGRTV